MSRLTAAQVISLGEYLQPDFDPASLTVNQLLGVFGFHNVAYPMPYTKPKLVQLFKDEITANATRYKRERVKRESSIASEDGITDGHTGKPLNQKSSRVVPARRTSRRGSKAPVESSDEEQALAPEPAHKPKRRRSSVQPAPATSSTLPVPPSPVVEVSEPEDSPVRKVIRKGRISNFAEDSGWEDNNIFQSGAEDSSPARPTPSKPRPPRKSIASTSKIPRKSRKASSAPPQLAPAHESLLRSQSPEKLPESMFEPELSLDAHRQTTAIVRNSRARSVVPASPAPPRLILAVPSAVLEEEEPLSQAPPLDEQNDVFGPISGTTSTIPAYGPPEEPLEDHTDMAMDENENEELEEALEDDDQDEEEEEEISPSTAQVRTITKTIANGSRAVARRGKKAASRPWYQTVLALAMTGILLQFAAGYKRDSAVVGFCDSGKDTNDVIEERRAELAAIKECNRLNRTLLYEPGEASTSLSLESARECPPPPLGLIPQPLACTPCPAHASCSRFTVACDHGYVLKPHWALSILPSPPPTSPSSAGGNVSRASEFIWNGISAVFDGVPGLGPIAFPPHCAIDLKRTDRVISLGEYIDVVLAKERGRRMCTGEQDYKDILESEGGEAKQWGYEVEALRKICKDFTRPDLLPYFDIYFNDAIQRLDKMGPIIQGEDAEGHVYLAHETGQLSWSCAVIVQARESWQEWRLRITSAFAALFFAWLLKQRQAARSIENKRVKEIAQIALDTLRNQELIHYTDPASAPAPYMSSDRLRDLVLQDETSLKARTALWTRVAGVVEANTNVRANLQETELGDETRVWRWLGTPGRIAG